MPNQPRGSSSLPPDDLSRHLAIAHLGDEDSLPHFGLVGDTYTITVAGKDTNDQFCVIDISAECRSRRYRPQLPCLELLGKPSLVARLSLLFRRL